MQQYAALAAYGLAVLASPALALEPPVSVDQAFADAFGAACVPGRLSYDGTREAALAAGWVVVDRTDHDELAVIMKRAGEEMGVEDDAGLEYDTTLYAKDVAGTRHHLTVSFLSSVITEGEPPFVQVGCNLYNFDAEDPIDPAPISALLDAPISHSIDREGLYGHVWGPPCSMPRTFDTYLGYYAADTPAALATGFDGVSLTFSTSSPAPGEVVPETYC
jgi:hypothetical protein